MQRIYSTLLLLTLFSLPIFAQEQIGVAAAVNRNTTDLTLEQETKLVEAGYQIIQNHTIETDEIGKAQMLLLDGTAFSVGPNSSGPGPFYLQPRDSRRLTRSHRKRAFKDCWR